MERLELKKVGSLDQVLSVREYAIAAGKDRGAVVYEVDNGALRFTVLRDHCLDISRCSVEGANVAFCSAAGETDGLAEGRAQFARNFGAGLLYTCGLDSTGTKDGHLQHGSIHWTPAEDASVTRNTDGIEIRGTMRSGGLFLPCLEMKRTIRAKPFSTEIEIEDTVRNAGFCDAEYALMYHINFGWPFIDEGTTIEADTESIEGLTEFARADVANAGVLTAPHDGEEERVYYRKVHEGVVKVKNPRTGRVGTVAYDCAALPELIQWKSMQSGAYALGIEPATTQFNERQTLLKLKSGEECRYAVKIGFEG